MLSAGSALATVASENDDLEIMAMVTVNDRPCCMSATLQDRHHRPVGVFLRHADRHGHLH